MKQIIKSTMIAAAFAASTLASNAALIGFDSGVAATTRGDGPFSIGNLIQIGATDVTINSLGIQDLGNVGLFAPTTVSIWTADGATVLGSVSIPADLSGTTKIGTYNYVSLASDLVLTAGTQYILGADVGGGIEFFFDGDTAAPYSGADGATIVNSVFGSTGAAPTATVDAGRFGAANAALIVVPEPSSAALVGLAGITLLLRRRR